MTKPGAASHSTSIERRTALVGTLSTLAVGPALWVPPAWGSQAHTPMQGPLSAHAPDLPPQGVAMISQSVMLSAADAMGEHFVAIRACQYPDAGRSWLWATVLTPNGFYQFAANNLAWSGPALPADANRPGIYVARGRKGRARANARFMRDGKLGTPNLARLSAKFDSDPALEASKGQVSVEAEFRPQSGYAGLLPGRTEAFGAAQIVLKVNGQSIEFSGPAQFHEQQQTDPRFTQAFAFASLWSSTLCATLLDSPPNSGAYVIDSQGPRGLRSPVATLAPDQCTFDFVDAGNPVSARFQTVKSYRVPLYSSNWQGRFVRGNLLGHSVVGMFNSWARS